jgi:hypothetical protein
LSALNGTASYNFSLLGGYAPASYSQQYNLPKLEIFMAYQPADLQKLLTKTERIAGKLKTLWRSQATTAVENSIFDLPIGEGGDHFLIEDVINEIEKLHYAIADLI